MIVILNFKMLSIWFILLLPFQIYMYMYAFFLSRWQMSFVPLTVPGQRSYSLNIVQEKGKLGSAAFIIKYIPSIL